VKQPRHYRDHLDDMFDNKGESGPPWGEPSAVGCSTPSTITPARKYRPINRSKRLS